jgi:hypothetical protein
MSPEEIEKVVGSVTVADVRRVANEKLWDQDLAIAARNPHSVIVPLTYSWSCRGSAGLPENPE